MMTDLTALEEWVGGLLVKLGPEQRRALSHQIAIVLRRSQSARISQQRAPDGTPYTPRKNRKELSSKAGRIKRQKAAMFSKLRTNKWLKVQSSEHAAGVSFVKKVYYVARVHQFGMQDRIGRKQATAYHYPTRQLLGFSEHDKARIEESILNHLTAG